MMKDMITHGIRASAIDVITAKSIACPESTLDEKTKKMGNGDVCTVNSVPTAFLRID